MLKKEPELSNVTDEIPKDSALEGNSAKFKINVNIKSIFIKIFFMRHYPYINYRTELNTGKYVTQYKIFLLENRLCFGYYNIVIEFMRP